jgi:hypothetical protein
MLADRPFCREHPPAQSRNRDQCFYKFSSEKQDQRKEKILKPSHQLSKPFIKASV